MKPGFEGELVFGSKVSVAMRENVERLFFFNPRQPLVHAPINAMVAETGIPELREEGEELWINVPSNRMQCLFACLQGGEPKLPVGVVLYYRSSEETIRVAHLAVDAAWVDSQADVGLRLIEKVRGVAHLIKGVTRVELPYRPERFLPV